MRARLSAAALLLACPAFGADFICPGDSSELNGPGLKIGRYDVGCDASPVAEGNLNECAVLRLTAAHKPAIVSLLKEDAEFRQCEDKPDGVACKQGKYTEAFIINRLHASAEEVKNLTDSTDPAAPLSLSVVCEHFASNTSNEKKPEKVVWLSDQLTFSREVSDALRPSAKGFDAPFMLNASHDRETEKSLIGLYGTIGYIIKESDKQALTASAKIDSAAGSERAKSSVGFGLNWSRYVVSERSRWFQDIHLRVSPTFLTDRAFDREVYQLSAQASIASEPLLRAGVITCPGGCKDSGNEWELYWLPTLGLDIGRVEDAAGVPNLMTIEEAGTYYRLVPSLSFSYKPAFWSDKLSFQLKYSHRYDLTEGWDRGLGSFGVDYAVGSNAFWSLVWRKGRQDGSFEPVDMLLLGIGIRQGP